jgi:hypothetical protein
MLLSMHGPPPHVCGLSAGFTYFTYLHNLHTLHIYIFYIFYIFTCFTYLQILRIYLFTYFKYLHIFTYLHILHILHILCILHIYVFYIFTYFTCFTYFTYLHILHIYIFWIFYIFTCFTYIIFFFIVKSEFFKPTILQSTQFLRDAYNPSISVSTVWRTLDQWMVDASPEPPHYAAFFSLLLYLPFGYKHSATYPRFYSPSVYALCVLRETTHTQTHARTYDALPSIHFFSIPR